MVENKTKDVSDAVGVVEEPPVVFATNVVPIVVASAPTEEEVFSDPETGVTVTVSAVTEENSNEHAGRLPSKHFVGDGVGTVAEEVASSRHRPGVDTSVTEQRNVDTKSPFHFLFQFLFYIALIWPMTFICGFLWIFVTPFASLTCNMCNRCSQKFLGSMTKRLIKILIQGDRGSNVNTISAIPSTPSSEFVNTISAIASFPSAEFAYAKDNTTEEAGPSQTSQVLSSTEVTMAQCSHQPNIIEDSAVPTKKTTSPFHFLIRFVFLIGIVWPMAFLCMIMWVFFAPCAGLFQQTGLNVVQFFEDGTLALVRSLGGKQV